MKKISMVLSLLLICALLLPAAGLAAVNYDLSVFENDPDLEVTFDEMDDSGEIKAAGGCILFGASDDDNGLFLGEIDIKIIPDYPPVIRFSFMYYGDKACMIDRFIVKPDETRYTFEVDSNIDYDSGKVSESFVIPITAKTIGLVEDILRSDVVSVKFRMDGSRDIDGDFVVASESLRKIYDAYIASGALNNDFTAFDLFVPCTIK